MDRHSRKTAQRRRRHHRVRRHVNGTPERPRLCVFRSARHMYCQIVDDTSHQCIGGCSTLSPGVREAVKSAGKIDAAAAVGREIARIAQEKGIKAVCFDRAGYKFHGRVKALAEAAREGGLKF